jgi:DNA-directed RNA polymerase specialized sigma24 family protein
LPKGHRRLEHGERPAEGDGSADGDVDPEDDRGDVGGDPRADAALDPERALIARQQAVLGPEAIRAALANVRDPRHREAVVLHHLEGWPIVDQDPAIETLCKRFGVGDRQIRTWIATAFAQMRRAIGAAP